MKTLIQKLVEMPGPSGFESRVRDLVREEIEPLVEKIKMAFDYKSTQARRARREKTRRVDRKSVPKRFLSAIYDFVYGSRRYHR